MLSFVFGRSVGRSVVVIGAAIVVRALEILSSFGRSGRAMMLIIIVIEWGKESRDQRSLQGKNCRRKIPVDALHEEWQTWQYVYI